VTSGTLYYLYVMHIQDEQPSDDWHLLSSKAVKPDVKLHLQNYSSGWGRCQTQYRKLHASTSCDGRVSISFQEQPWAIYGVVNFTRTCNMEKLVPLFPMSLGWPSHPWDMDDFDVRRESSIFASSLRHHHQSLSLYVYMYIHQAFGILLHRHPNQPVELFVFSFPPAVNRLPGPHCGMLTRGNEARSSRHQNGPKRFALAIQYREYSRACDGHSLPCSSCTRRRRLVRRSLRCRAELARRLAASFGGKRLKGLPLETCILARKMMMMIPVLAGQTRLRCR
jgi:hypothetical protein